MLARIHTGIPGKEKFIFYLHGPGLSLRLRPLRGRCAACGGARGSSHSSHSSSPKARPCWSHSLATAAQASSTLRPSASSAKNLLMASFFFFYLSGLQASL
ncbi:hypothetical protein EBI_27679 [Enterocytozoon bieneusi H348]|nr:hypothetical protein EBI_27679 [Enterocytozoon bieneusi H348]|eukprot:XP_002652115.1 hypothetical protein EBI_27679 [Enterocytozoon bieneusi H348]